MTTRFIINSISLTLLGIFFIALIMCLIPARVTISDTTKTIDLLINFGLWIVYVWSRNPLK